DNDHRDAGPARLLRRQNGADWLIFEFARHLRVDPRKPAAQLDAGLQRHLRRTRLGGYPGGRSRLRAYLAALRRGAYCRFCRNCPAALSVIAIRSAERDETFAQWPASPRKS